MPVDWFFGTIVRTPLRTPLLRPVKKRPCATTMSLLSRKLWTIKKSPPVSSFVSVGWAMPPKRILGFPIGRLMISRPLTNIWLRIPNLNCETSVLNLIFSYWIITNNNLNHTNNINICQSLSPKFVEVAYCRCAWRSPNEFKLLGGQPVASKTYIT